MPHPLIALIVDHGPRLMGEATLAFGQFVQSALSPRVSETLNTQQPTPPIQEVDQILPPTPPTQANDPEPLTLTERLIGGGFFGMMLATVTHPFNVLSNAQLSATTRAENPVQISSMGESVRFAMRSAQEIYGSMGIGGFFQRLGPRSIMAAGTFAVLSLGAELYTRTQPDPVSDSVPLHPTRPSASWMVGTIVVENMGVRTPLLIASQLPTNAGMDLFMSRMRTAYQPSTIATLTTLRMGYFGSVDVSRSATNWVQNTVGLPNAPTRVLEAGGTLFSAITVLQLQEQLTMNPQTRIQTLLSPSRLGSQVAGQFRNIPFTGREGLFLAGVRFREEGSSFIINQGVRPLWQSICNLTTS